MLTPYRPIEQLTPGLKYAVVLAFLAERTGVWLTLDELHLALQFDRGEIDAILHELAALDLIVMWVEGEAVYYRFVP